MRWTVGRQLMQKREIFHSKCEKLSEYLVDELIISTAVFLYAGTQIFTDQSQFTLQQAHLCRALLRNKHIVHF